MSARSLARFIILSRSRDKAFLLSSSSSGGIALKTPSIAISFASAKLTFISCNSCSILSNVRSDKSCSHNINERHYGGCTPKRQRRSRRNGDWALNRPAAAGGFRQNQPFTQVLDDRRRPARSGHRRFPQKSEPRPPRWVTRDRQRYPGAVRRSRQHSGRQPVDRSAYRPQCSRSCRPAFGHNHTQTRCGQSWQQGHFGLRD